MDTTFKKKLEIDRKCLPTKNPRFLTALPEAAPEFMYYL